MNGKTSSDANQVRLTCKQCGNKQIKEIESNQVIGPHEQIKQGMGLPQRDSDDIVIRRKGYGTMPAICCEVCGCLKHDIYSLTSETKE